MEQQQIDAGYFGEEVERWEAREPKPPRRLALGCYEELQPLYVFLVNYAQQSANEGQVLPFDISRLDRYEKYITVMWKEPSRDFRFSAFSFGVLNQTVRQMVNKEISYHKGMERLYNHLKDARLEPYVSRKRAYTGKHLDALAERYDVRYKEWQAEGKRIAANNLKKRGETNE